MLRLLRDWERLQFRECNYKNHRIFTLRCLHNDLVPVSIKLKSTLRSERARKRLRSAEKQLLQTRLKSISSLLDNNAKQIELTMSQIAFNLPTPSYTECQEFIEKVKELRFKKVKERQVRKFNNLLNKKEGNITLQISQVTPAARVSTQAANRQATLAPAARIPPQVTINSQAGRQASPQVIVRQASQADSTLSQSESAVPRQATPRLPQQTVLFLSQRVQFPRQATLRLPKQTVLFLSQRVKSPRQATPRQPQ